MRVGLVLLILGAAVILGILMRKNQADKNSQSIQDLRDKFRDEINKKR